MVAQAQAKIGCCIVLAGMRDAVALDHLLSMRFPELRPCRVETRERAVEAIRSARARQQDVVLLILSDEIPGLFSTAEALRGEVGSVPLLLICADTDLENLRRKLPFSPAIADAWIVSGDASAAELGSTIGAAIETSRREHRAARMRGMLNEQLRCTQVSEAQLRQQRMQQGEAYLSQVLRDLHDAVLAVDEQGGVLGCNLAASRLFGWTDGKMPGRNMLGAFPDGQREELLALLRRATAGDSVVDHPVVLALSGGGTRDAELRISPTHGPDTVLSVIVRDVTRRRAHEAQLRQMENLATIGRLAGGIAHEYNNLLTVILGTAELLEEDESADAYRRKLAASIRIAADRGAELTDRLLAFSRRQPLLPEQVDLNRLLSGMEGLLRKSMGESIRIESSLCDDPCRTMVDSARFESAMLSLCLNARDAMPKGGLLRIETANLHTDQDRQVTNDTLPAGHYATVRVADTGTGMAPEVVARAFEPFFSTKDVGQGVGLGLSMVYGFVRQSGGYVALNSEPNRGTSITLYFPAAHA